DLVQEALLRVRKGLETYRPGSMEGWLSRIVTNVFLDEVRRKRRRPVEVLPEDPERLLPSAPGADEAGDGLSGDVQAAPRRPPRGRDPPGRLPALPGRAGRRGRRPAGDPGPARPLRPPGPGRGRPQRVPPVGRERGRAGRTTPASRVGRGGGGGGDRRLSA